MKWVSVEDELPRDGQAVLVRRNQDNWGTLHTLEDGSEHKIWRWKACQFIRGKVKPGRHEVIYPEDQHGNNLRPYIWDEFGPGRLFGQDVSHWAAISDPMEPSQ